MTAKPSVEQERAAQEFIDALVQQQAHLAGGLETLDKALRENWLDQPPSLDDLLYRCELLAPWGRRQSSADARSVLAKLQAIRIADTRQHLRPIMAYLLKYRFVELTDVSRTTIDGLDIPVWDLPDGYQELLAEPTSGDGEAIKSISRKLQGGFRSAPWLGSLSKEGIVESVKILAQLGVVEFAHDRRLIADGSSHTGVPVLRLSDGYPSSSIQRWIAAAIEQEQNRAALVIDLGIGVRGVGGYQTHKILREASGNDVVKIATYHFRTVVGDRPLSEWLQRNETLRVRVLCLGPTAIDELTEGADPESLANSLLEGMHSFNALRKSLPDSAKDAIEIRVYGDRQAGALFRGVVLCASDSTTSPVRRVVSTVWPFGTCRANYGEVLVLDGDSSLSRLCSEYYDSAWENAVPLPIGGRFVRARWILQSVRAEILSAGIVGIVAVAVLLLGGDGVNYDALFALLAVLPILAIAIWRAALRAWRAGRLSYRVRSTAGRRRRQERE